MSIIKPTVGRKVWFRPFGNLRRALEVIDASQPCDATITYVWSDRMVNLMVTGHYGVLQRANSITLLQAGDTPPSYTEGGYAEWMPYQQGQAAKTEVAEKRAADAAARPAAEAIGVVAAKPVTEDELSERLAGPRVTMADIEAEIASEHYFTAEEGAFASMKPPRGADIVPPALSLLTFCVLVLRNGFTVTGESACADPANFRADIGRRVAREKAIEKTWSLLGFRLRDKLASVKAGCTD